MSEILHFVGNLKDFEKTSRKLVEIQGQILVVILHEGKFFALEERCPHRAGPLSEGKIESGCIVCPWHDSHFEIETGKRVSGPAKVGIRTYPVVIDQEKVFLRFAMPQNK